MNNDQIFGNLNTSFVDLDALVKHLRRQSFVGTVQLDFDDYTAKIVLAETGKIHVREHVERSGKVAIGEKAYYRVLDRSKAPGGQITVLEPRCELLYQDVAAIVDNLWNENTATASLPMSRAATAVPSKEPVRPGHDPDHNLLVEVTATLLKTIDGAFGQAGLDFATAFEKACREVSVNHPFLAPEVRQFKYSGGLIYLNDDTDAKKFLNGISDALAKVFKRLAEAPELKKASRYTAQKVRVLVHERKNQFDQLFLTPQIERALGA